MECFVLKKLKRKLQWNAISHESIFCFPFPSMQGYNYNRKTSTIVFWMWEIKRTPNHWKKLYVYQKNAWNNKALEYKSFNVVLVEFRDVWVWLEVGRGGECGKLKFDDSLVVWPAIPTNVGFNEWNMKH